MCVCACVRVCVVRVRVCACVCVCVHTALSWVYRRRLTLKHVCIYSAAGISAAQSASPQLREGVQQHGGGGGGGKGDEAHDEGSPTPVLDTKGAAADTKDEGNASPEKNP